MTDKETHEYKIQDEAELGRLLSQSFAVEEYEQSGSHWVKQLLNDFNPLNFETAIRTAPGKYQKVYRVGKSSAYIILTQEVRGIFCKVTYDEYVFRANVAASKSAPLFSLFLNGAAIEIETANIELIERIEEGLSHASRSIICEELRGALRLNGAPITATLSELFSLIVNAHNGFWSIESKNGYTYPVQMHLDINGDIPQVSAIVPTTMTSAVHSKVATIAPDVYSRSATAAAIEVAISSLSDFARYTGKLNVDLLSPAHSLISSIKHTMSKREDDKELQSELATVAGQMEYFAGKLRQLLEMFKAVSSAAQYTDFAASSATTTHDAILAAAPPIANAYNAAGADLSVKIVTQDAIQQLNLPGKLVIGIVKTITAGICESITSGRKPITVANPAEVAQIESLLNEVRITATKNDSLQEQTIKFQFLTSVKPDLYSTLQVAEMINLYKHRNVDIDYMDIFLFNIVKATSRLGIFIARPEMSPLEWTKDYKMCSIVVRIDTQA